jgi:hypothetical protein
MLDVEQEAERPMFEVNIGVEQWNRWIVARVVLGSGRRISVLSVRERNELNSR